MERFDIQPIELLPYRDPGELLTSKDWNNVMDAIGNRLDQRGDYMKGDLKFGERNDKENDIFITRKVIGTFGDNRSNLKIAMATIPYGSDTDTDYTLKIGHEVIKPNGGHGPFIPNDGGVTGGIHPGNGSPGDTLLTFPYFATKFSIDNEGTAFVAGRLGIGGHIPNESENDKLLINGGNIVVKNPTGGLEIPEYASGFIRGMWCGVSGKGSNNTGIEVHVLGNLSDGDPEKICTSVGILGKTEGINSYEYGVYGSANGQGTENGFKHGVFGKSTGRGNNYGIYGTASGGTKNFAGYFDNGDVYIKGGLGIGRNAKGNEKLVINSKSQKNSQAPLLIENINIQGVVPTDEATRGLLAKIVSNKDISIGIESWAIAVGENSFGTKSIAITSPLNGEKIFKSSKSEITFAVFLPRAPEKIIICYSDGYVRLWDTEDSSEPLHSIFLTEKITYLDFYDNYVFATISNKNLIQFWKLNDDRTSFSDTGFFYDKFLNDGDGANLGLKFWSRGSSPGKILITYFKFKIYSTFVVFKTASIEDLHELNLNRSIEALNFLSSTEMIVVFSRTSGYYPIQKITYSDADGFQQTLISVNSPSKCIDAINNKIAIGYENKINIYDKDFNKLNEIKICFNIDLIKFDSKYPDTLIAFRREEEASNEKYKYFINLIYLNSPDYNKLITYSSPDKYDIIRSRMDSIDHISFLLSADDGILALWVYKPDTVAFGVYGRASGDNGQKYGIYGIAEGSGNNYAGYFDGDVKITNQLILNSPDSLIYLNNLKYDTYKYSNIEISSPIKSLLSLTPRETHPPNQPTQIGYNFAEIEALGLKELLIYEGDKPTSVNYEKLCVYLLEIVRQHEAMLNPGAPELKRFMLKPTKDSALEEIKLYLDINEIPYEPKESKAKLLKKITQ